MNQSQSEALFPCGGQPQFAAAQGARAAGVHPGWGVGISASLAIHAATAAALVVGSWFWHDWLAAVLMPAGLSSPPARPIMLEVSFRQDTQEATPVEFLGDTASQQPQTSPVSPLGRLPPPVPEAWHVELDSAEPTPLPGEAVLHQRRASSIPATPIDGPSLPPDLPRQAATAELPPPEGLVAAPLPTTVASGAASDAQAVFSPAPTYPAELLAARVAGRVRLLVKVDSSGRVVSAKVETTSGYASFDRAALDVIHRWRFTAGRQQALLVPIRFKIVEE